MGVVLSGIGRSAGWYCECPSPGFEPELGPGYPLEWCVSWACGVARRSDGRVAGLKWGNSDDG